MTTVYLSPVFNGYQSFLSNGLPNAGGFLNTYAAGTSTPVATYTTSAGTIANANPIQLGADGRPPQEIWIVSGTAVKFVLTDASSSVIGTYDNIAGVGDQTALLAFESNLANSSNSSYGASLVGYKGRTVYARLGDIVSVLDFAGVDPSGATDSTAGIQAAISYAINTSGTLYFPTGLYKHNGLVIDSLTGFDFVGERQAPNSSGIQGAILEYTGTGDAITLRNTTGTGPQNNGIGFIYRFNMRHIAMKAISGTTCQSLIKGINPQECSFYDVGQISTSTTVNRAFDWDGLALSHMDYCTTSGATTGIYFHCNDGTITATGGGNGAVTITRCNIFQGLVGIDLGYMLGINIYGNYFEDFQNAIRLDNSQSGGTQAYGVNIHHNNCNASSDYTVNPRFFKASCSTPAHPIRASINLHHNYFSASATGTTTNYAYEVAVSTAASFLELILNVDENNSYYVNTALISTDSAVPVINHQHNNTFDSFGGNPKPDILIPYAGSSSCDTIYCNNAPTSAPADTTEDVLATINIPYRPGPNAVFDITALLTCNNNANVKTARIRWGYAGGPVIDTISMTSTTFAKLNIIIANQNATNVQKIYSENVSASGVVSNSLTSDTRDTNILSQIVITGQKATVGDTLTLESCTCIMKTP